MKLEYYIDKIKAVDVFNLKPLVAYEQLLGVIHEYYDDTDDDCLLQFRKERECIEIYEEVEETLAALGWKDVWKLLRHIPEESITDDYFIEENGCLRPIRTEDAARLQKEALETLQNKLKTPEDRLIQDLRGLGEITPYNRQFYKMSDLVQEYARDTGDSEIKEYLKRYTSHLGIRDNLKCIIENTNSARNAAFCAKALLDDLNLDAEVFHDDNGVLEPATTTGLDSLRDEIVDYLLKKEGLK